MILLLVMIGHSLYAQLNSIIVEKYYISDNSDASFEQYFYNDQGDIVDTLKLSPGSTTYRIYVRLAAGSKLTKVFGDDLHPLMFSSTDYFFNDIDRGRGMGSEIKTTNLKWNLLALDSWLTMGLASSSKSGVLKEYDSDGSVLGSSENPYLKNVDPLAGSALNIADGLESTTAPEFFINGIDKQGNDSTIFGSLCLKNNFESNSVSIIVSDGVEGTGPDKTDVLVAQLTTKGVLSFELNIEILTATGLPMIYVAKPLSGETDFYTSSYLTYTSACGCTDPKYLEYSPNVRCSTPDSCKTIAVIGCTDPRACNYDPEANFLVPSLCCYPGSCAGRDISEVCPDLGNNRKATMLVYPIPSESKITIDVESGLEGTSILNIYNFYGKLVISTNIHADNNPFIADFDISSLESGIYMVHLSNGDKTYTRTFVKCAKANN